MRLPGKKHGGTQEQQLQQPAINWRSILARNVGIPGRVSTEVDARLSFDKEKKYRESAPFLRDLLPAADVDANHAF